MVHRPRGSVAASGRTSTRHGQPVLDFARGEARRYLRAASVLLGHAECAQGGRMILLRRAEHLLRLVLAAVEQQLERAAAPELVDDAATEPLTATTSARTMGGEP